MFAASRALKESVISATASCSKTEPVESVPGVDYIRWWRITAHGADRLGLKALTLVIVYRLNELMRALLVHNSLRLMRRPIRAARLSGLQRFLESGFVACLWIEGAPLYRIVDEPKRTLASALFTATPENAGNPVTIHALTKMPAARPEL